MVIGPGEWEGLVLNALAVSKLWAAFLASFLVRN